MSQAKSVHSTQPLRLPASPAGIATTIIPDMLQAASRARVTP
jgi:hypothetical protein